MRHLLPILLLLIAGIASAQDDDRAICNRTFAFSFEKKLIDRPIGEVAGEIGQKFIGSPYAAGTLDSAGPEHLVVNLRAFDCVTFVENVLALSRSVKRNKLTFDGYQNELRQIRYREGKLFGYTSRLHYFLDWIGDNERKGFIDDMSARLGGVDATKKIDFMTAHQSAYSHLKGDSTVAAISEREKDLSSTKWYYIPSADVEKAAARIHTGDIIAIATSVKGLDISHTGIAIQQKDGTLHMMHAPDVGQSVTITEKPLAKYLLAHPKDLGIVVLRPMEPHGDAGE